MIKIESKRTFLRDYARDGSDLESILRFTGDPEVATHSSWGPLTRDETMDYMNKALMAIDAQPRVNFALALVLKSTNELIGNVSLNIRNPQTREAEIGYTLRRDQWHQGYASEAARAVIHFGFTELGLHRIFATTSPHNVPSQRVLEKIGLKREGYLRKNVLQRGSWRDSVLYAVLEDDWPRV
ncbi:GNAT family N-acetyltransferase [Oligoflexus tunisiensis]|uniref:GNAT family N-acetyltransferase n=1 Tax=Oligoflexus tunisiensis TaxID=708132 RepID=UPI000A73E9E9|nr:GNAT family N-acetyltransferase [Oligoflexus tunisiensis]